METLINNQNSLVITWHPGCVKTSAGKYILCGVGNGSLTSGELYDTNKTIIWKKPELPNVIVFYIESKFYEDFNLIKQIIQEFRELEDSESEIVEKNLIYSSLEIRCDKNCKFYQLMKKNGILEKYYPEW